MHKMTRIHRAGALTLITALLLLTLAGLSGTGAAAKTYQTGDVIEFGAYPQTKITDAAYVSNVDFCGYGVRPAIVFQNGIVDQWKPAEVAPMRGDGDGDGRVTARDARSALRVSARLETLSAQAVKNLDLDSDGKVSAAEARWILRYSAKLEKTLDFIRKPSKLTVGSYALSFGRYESSDGMTTLQIGSDGSVTQTFIDGMCTSGKWSVVTDSIGQKFMQIDWGDGTENYNVYANDKFSDAWRGAVTYSYVGA